MRLSLMQSALQITKITPKIKNYIEYTIICRYFPLMAKILNITDRKIQTQRNLG